MRVFVVLREFYCPSLPIGGAERQALKLARELQKNGVAVTVVTGLWEWGQSRREVIQGIPVHRHFTGWGIFGIKGLGKFGQYFYLLSLFLYLIWHRQEYDIIHCHSAMFEASITWRTLPAHIIPSFTVNGQPLTMAGVWPDGTRFDEVSTKRRHGALHHHSVKVK